MSIANKAEGNEDKGVKIFLVGSTNYENWQEVWLVFFIYDSLGCSKLFDAVQSLELLE